MAMQIDEVQADLEVTSDATTGASASVEEMAERMRPLILEVLNEELERFRRSRG